MLTFLPTPILKKGKGGQISFLNINPSLMTSYQKNYVTSKRFLRHPRPKSRPVKVLQLSDFYKVPFRLGLTYTPVNCIIVFLLSIRLKQGISQNGLEIKNASFAQHCL